MSKRFRRESRDVGSGALLAMGALLGALALAAVSLHWLQVWLFHRLEEQDASRPSALSVLPPEPRLQARPAYDLYLLRREEDQKLRGWSWADRKAGLARIPIERAMDLVAEDRARRARR